MIIRPQNWDNVQAFSERRALPVGAYVCRIKNAAVKNTEYGDQLFILFDIEDGEYAGFYKEAFDRDTREDKKWKGVLRQFLPKNDGSQKDEWTKSSLKGLVTSIEESNRGYTWNWDESTLAKKLIGIIFRNEEWEYEGKSGWTVRPFRACSVDTVADGSYTIPKDKPLKNKETGSSFGGFATPTPSFGSAPAMDYGALPEDDDDLPF